MQGSNIAFEKAINPKKCPIGSGNGSMNEKQSRVNVENKGLESPLAFHRQSDRPWVRIPPGVPLKPLGVQKLRGVFRILVNVNFR